MNPTEFTSWLNDPNRAPLVMGVLNVTPDSFSDGGKFATREAAVTRAEQLVSEGAAIVDIGGESTRPGSQPVSADEQIRRVVPVLKTTSSRLNGIFSIDTTSAAVAEAALDAGAGIVNDISAGRGDTKMFSLVARRGVPIILMHMQGTPATMQALPQYSDVVADVAAFLRERIAAAEAAGIEAGRILIDPGIGFGKTIFHNLELLRRQGEFLALDRPMVIGASRKSFLGKITGEAEPAQRLFGTAAAVAWSVANGAHIVRVHDVEPMAQVVRTIRAIENSTDFLTS